MKKCFVYFIKADVGGKNHPMKIGVAYNPAKRLDELQTGSPYKLSVVSCVEMPNRAAAYNLENYLHKVFDRYRMCGEWFRSKNINLGKAFQNYDSNMDTRTEFYNGDVSQMHSKKTLQADVLKRQNEKLLKIIEQLQGDIDEYLDEMQRVQ